LIHQDGRRVNYVFSPFFFRTHLTFFGQAVLAKKYVRILGGSIEN
jgi:hypothetical protein